MKTSQILNNNIWATIKPSKINGVGVFAIRDIPKGINISENTTESKSVNLFYPIDEEDFNNIIPEIQDIILDRMLYKEDEFFMVANPNAEVLLQSFMNHSSLPNTDGRVTLRDIKKGEELTEDYSPYLISGHAFTKNKIKGFVK